MMSENVLLAVPPTVVRLKFDSGAGPAVKPKVSLPLVVSLMMVIEPGKTTAAADSERSWLPPEPSRAMSRVWYGEPEMFTAEFNSPQSARAAIWPPQARTGLATLAVKVIVMRADLSPLKPVP